MLGLDFLELKPKLRKRGAKKNSIIDPAGKHCKNKITLDRPKHFDGLTLFKGNVSQLKIKYHKNSIIKINLDENKRCKSSRSTSRNNQRSIQNQKEIQEFMHWQNKKRKIKEKKEQLKLKKDNLKMVKQLHDLHNFVSKKLKSDLHSERTFDGVIPQHISKRIQNKRMENSQTPVNVKNESHISSSQPFNYKERSKTDLNFYPEKESLQMQPVKERNIEDMLEEHKRNINKQTIVSEEKSQQETMQENFSQLKSKFNPSPFKKREKSIDELIRNLQEKINEMEAEEVKLFQKSKYQQNKMKPKLKKPKKKKQKKARSHSPKELPKQKIKDISTIQDQQNNKLLGKSKNDVTARRASVKKSSKIPQINNIKQVGIKQEGETKHLKIKSSIHLKDKQIIKSYSKPFVGTSKSK